MNPDWVITGMPHEGGVRIIASKNLKPGGEVQIVERIEEARDSRGRPAGVGTYRHDHWRISVNAVTVEIVDAPDYPTALRMLMSGWSVPEHPEPVREIFTTRHEPWQSGLYPQIEPVSGDTQAGTDPSQAARLGEPPRGAAAPAPAPITVPEECPTCWSTDRHDRTKYRGIDPRYPQDGVVALLCPDDWHRR